MKEFNFRRAHSEWAQPQYDALPACIRLLWNAVATNTQQLRQNQSCNVEWPADLPELKEMFDEVAPDTLARAAVVIYYWGHWSHISRVTVHYPGLPPKEFDVAGETFPMTKPRQWVEMMDFYPPPRGDVEPRYDVTRAGPDNEQTCDACWKFASLARQSATSRGFAQSEEHVMSELGYDKQSFMDHKPGTDYSDDEKHELFVAPLESTGAFQPVKVITCNFQPHPFVIGPRHVEYANKHCNGVLGDDALRAVPCAGVEGRYPGRRCGLAYEQHTFDRVLVLRILRDVPNAEAVTILQSLQSLMEEHKIDGVAFVKSVHKILDPIWMVEVICTSDVPQNQWDSDDVADNPTGRYTFKPQAPNEEEAREKALDEFHSTVPIACLENFQIEANVLPREQATPADSDPV